MSAHVRTGMQPIPAAVILFLLACAPWAEAAKARPDPAPPSGRTRLAQDGKARGGKESPGEKPAPPEEKRALTLAGKRVVGLEEWVLFPGTGHRTLARVDTGADTSSLDAVDIERAGEGEGGLKRGDVIRFSTRAEGGGRREMRARILRFAPIKRKGAPPQRRPVIELEICFGGKRLRTQATLADRRNFKYPMLIGRNVLEKGYLVDVRLKRNWEARCLPER